MEFSHLLIYVLSFFGIFSFCLFIITFFDKRNMRNFSAKLPARLPTVSMIIPAHNAEHGVEKSIRSLLNLDYPKEKLEIIVVDDGSTDNTYKIASKYKSKGVKVYPIPYGGKGKALNYGIMKSKGEFVGNLDSDSSLDRDALLKMVGFFSNKKVMAVTPSIKANHPKTIAQKIQAIEFLSSSIIKKVFSYFGAMPIASGACTIFRKSFFEKHGCYLEDSLAEDGEMSLRIAEKGYRIENAMDTAVYTDGVKTFKSLFNQRLRWFRGLLDCLIIHKRLFHPSKGNISLIVLPMISISILLTLIGSIYLLSVFLSKSFHNLINFKSIGFDLFYLFEYKIDFFNINIGATAVLPLILIIFSIILMMVCKKYSREHRGIMQSYLLFFFIYWIVASLSWIRAFFYKLTGKKIKWGSRWL